LVALTHTLVNIKQVSIFIGVEVAAAAGAAAAAYAG